MRFYRSPPAQRRPPSTASLRLLPTLSIASRLPCWTAAAFALETLFFARARTREESGRPIDHFRGEKSRLSAGFGDGEGGAVRPREALRLLRRVPQQPGQRGHPHGVRVAHPLHRPASPLLHPSSLRPPSGRAIPVRARPGLGLERRVRAYFGLLRVLRVPRSEGRVFGRSALPGLLGRRQFRRQQARVLSRLEGDFLESPRLVICLLVLVGSVEILPSFLFSFAYDLWVSNLSSLFSCALIPICWECQTS